jgi:RNA polymerase sigma factor (sigma-70 family)
MRAAVEQYEAPLTQYVTRLVRGDVERARDVVQDAFMKLWSVDRAGVESHLGQWLYRVCRNRALDVRRKESRMTALQDDQLDGTVKRHDALRSSLQDDDSAASPMREERGPAVIDMLESLNETQQEALRLKFQGGLSYKEIATVMDITSNHVGVLIHNAIKALRDRMSSAATGREPSAHAAATSTRGGRK